MMNFKVKKGVLSFVGFFTMLLSLAFCANAQLFGKKKSKKSNKTETAATKQPISEEDITSQSKKRRKRKNKDNNSSVSSSAENDNTNRASQQKKASGKRKQELAYPDSKFKKKYRISIIIPLNLDELVRGESVTFKDKVPDKAADGLAF